LAWFALALALAGWTITHFQSTGWLRLSRRAKRPMVLLIVFVSCGALGAAMWLLVGVVLPVAGNAVVPAQPSPIVVTPGLPQQPIVHRVVLRTMGTGKLEYIPEIKKQGIKVSMILDNETIPDTELQNVSGQVWAERKYLLAKIAQTMSPLDHPWVKDRDRLRYHIWQPVLPKMSHEWLPTLVFALPPPGEKAIFGGEIVSKTTDFKQYRWWLANENGNPVVHGGDATPQIPILPK
jgi:hypothetical protein